MKTTLLSMLLATVAFAANADVVVVNPGSEQGLLREALTDATQTLETRFVQANNPVTASQYFGQQDVVTVWSSEWPSDPNLPAVTITEDNLAGLLVTETVICSREYTSLEEMSGQTVQIATWGNTTVSRFISNFGAENNINFEIVPYEGSGAMVRGYAGGDADTIFTIESREASVLADTNTTCFAYSKNGDIDYQFVDAIITLNSTPEITQTIRDNIGGMSLTEKWETGFVGSTFEVEGDLITIFNQSVENFRD